MAISSRDKLTIVIDAKDTASKEIVKLRGQLKKLGGPNMVKAQKEIRKLNRELKLVGGSAKKGKPLFGRFAQGIALGNIAANAATAAFSAMSRAISSAVKQAVGNAATYQSTMASLRSVTQATGRDINAVFFAMQTQLGGLASKTQVAEGFLKGLTTTLSVNQINNMTTAVKNASLAMGEDFGQQLPLIIKAIKQLNPAILDNIGVTIRLDKINKQIRDGYFGVNTAVNEATQQQAIYQEIIKQTAQFQGQEEVRLGTAQGRWQALQVAIDDAMTSFGRVVVENPDILTALEAITNVTRGIIRDFDIWVDATVSGVKIIGNAFQLLLLPIKAVATSIATTFGAMVDIMTGNFEKGFAALRSAGEGLVVDLVEDWAQLNAAVADFGVALLLLNAEPAKDQVNELGRAALTLEQLIENIPPVIILSDEDANEQLDNFEDMNKAIQKTVRTEKKAVTIIAAHWQLARESTANATDNAVDNMLDKFWGMQKAAKTVFGQMAQDFSKFFIGEILRKITFLLVPKFLSLLKIFDVPANDRFAMSQGADFMKFFTAGLVGQFAGANVSRTLARGIRPNIPFGSFGIGGSHPSTAATTGLPQSGGGLVLNFYGPITDQDFVRNVIAPAVEDAARDGEVGISVKDDDMQTGSRSVVTSGGGF